MGGVVQELDKMVYMVCSEAKEEERAVHDVTSYVEKASSKAQEVSSDAHKTCSGEVGTTRAKRAP